MRINNLNDFNNVDDEKEPIKLMDLIIMMMLMIQFKIIAIM